jgi:asparagine synthase (glutamine-hydrolysing)
LVTNAEKQGFSAPDASWFKGDSIDFVKRVLLNGEASIFEFMDPSVVKSLVIEHLNGSENRRLLIWSLLNIEQWLNDSEIGLRVCPKVS